MDSGSAVPTLKPGVSETVAAKLLTVARGRRGGAMARAGASNDSCCCGLAAAVEAAAFMLLRKARFLALDNAGSNRAASTAITATTTISSINVKALRR